jgi:hypothetical protein
VIQLRVDEANESVNPKTGLIWNDPVRWAKTDTRRKVKKSHILCKTMVIPKKIAIDDAQGKMRNQSMSHKIINETQGKTAREEKKNKRTERHSDNNEQN